MKKYLPVILLLFFLSSCLFRSNTVTLTRIAFGRAFRLGEPICEYHSERSFNGDGYSIAVFRVPEGRSFDSAVEATLNDPRYPEKPRYRDGWKLKLWTSTPPAEGEQVFIDFCLEDYGVKNQGLDQARGYLKLLMSEPGIYYAYFYFLHDFDGGTNVGGIDFFIYSPARRIFLTVNHNT
jgi:hypothetical protein